jgi:GNAT superfamily N-acetyltransferase
MPLVRYTPADAAKLLELSESIGWPHTIAEWQTALDAAVVVGHREPAAESHDWRAVSSSALFSFGPGLSALALVIVREGYRGRGIAREAIAECLALAGDGPIMLVATTEGVPIYQALGFRTVEMKIRVAGPVGLLSTVPRIGEPWAMTLVDMPNVNMLDQRAYGADRSHVLRARWASVDHAVICTEGLGYGWRAPRRERKHIGPLIATSLEHAMAMLLSLTRELEPDTVIQMDIPTAQAEFISLLTILGFEAAPTTQPVMLRGADRLPGDRSMIYAMGSLGWG